MQRAQWGSKAGFILASAGSAVGLGCIWKFPYMTASNGGGAFLLIFLGMVLTLGLALMRVEMALGRAGKSGIFGTVRALGGKRWMWLGVIAVVSSFAIMSFYSVVGGWTVAYLVQSLQGGLPSGEPSVLKAAFTDFIAEPVTPIIYHGVFMAMTLAIVVGGIDKGIEKLSKVLMPLLFVLMLILTARGLTLPGAMEGVAFMFKPDFSQVTIETVVSAMGLAFFSLSLGMGAMMAYGSYLKADSDLPNASAWVLGITLMSCLLGGLMVIPPAFAAGVGAQAGPGLTFITMPALFAHMPAGEFFAALFFALLLVAALTSSISLLEVVTNFCIEELGLTRRRAAIGTAVGMFLMGIPASLSFGLWADITFMGKTVFDLLDYVSSNVLLPLGGIGVALLAGWVAWPTFERELTGQGQHPVRGLKALRVLVSWVAPAVIGVVLVHGL